jgi:hypothetical protein
MPSAAAAEPSGAAFSTPLPCPKCASSRRFAQPARRKKVPEWMREFSSALYRVLRLGSDDPLVRLPLALLVALALITIGAAAAHDWRAAPAAERPRLSAVELKPANRASARNTKSRATKKPAAAAKKSRARRAGRNRVRRARTPPSRRAATTARRGGSPASTPAAPRPTSRAGGAPPAQAPVSAPAGEDDDDDDDGNSDGDD